MNATPPSNPPPPGGRQALEPLGIIAGSRSLPLIFAREVRRRGVHRLVAVAVEGETERALADLADEVVWLRVGQLNRLIRAFVERGVRRCVMLGQIAPANLFDLRPDLRTLGVLLRLKERNAHTLFGAVIEELAKEGIEVIEALPWLTSEMPGPGYWNGRVPSGAQWEDVQLGLRIAREIARLDIGQSVVVKEGTVLAVEGFEGTDECLKRGGRLAGKTGGAVAVKVAKAGHDMRFDIPCIGPRTVEICAESGIAVLAFDPGRTLLLERAELESAVARTGLCLVAGDVGVPPPAP